MGTQQSKKEVEDEEKPLPFIFYDQHGLLRKGVVSDDGTIHDRDRELQRILALEAAFKEAPLNEQREWFIVESGWIRTWLSYCRFGTSSLGESFSSPAPPYINNESLLLMTADTDAPSYASLAEEARQGGEWPRFKWTIKTGLFPAGQGQGHFRRVNKYVWAAFCEMYKGSGPEIKYVEEEAVIPTEEILPTSTGDKAKSTAAGAASVDTKDAAKAAKVSDVSAVAANSPPSDNVAVDPNRWQDSSTWVVDQSQGAFLIKFGEERFPKKTEQERREQMWIVWNAKRLKKVKEDEQEALETAAAANADGAAAEDGEKIKSTGSQSDSKIGDEEDDDDDDDGEDDDEEEEEEEEEKNGDSHVVSGNSGVDGTEEQTVRNPLSQELSSARETTSTNNAK